MKKVFFIATLAISLATNALNYTISFTGSGASSSIDQVVVQNLTQSTSVIVPAGNVLNLSDVATSTQQFESNNDGLIINQQAQDLSITFLANQTGETQVIVYGIDGRKIASLNQNLEAGNQSFLLSLPKGIYVIKVCGNDFNYTAKAISQSFANALAQISYVGSDKVIVNNNPQKSKSSGITSISYNAGDQLLYKATSGNYSTIVTDVPTGDKTTDFGFVACTDADGNNYTVVTIGTQTWMAENLKTAKYRNGNNISNLTVDGDWASAWTLSIGAWCDNNNDAANDSKYGKLYNWYAVNDSRNIAPIGWHVATDSEWSILESYVSNNYDCSLTQAKALASTSVWMSGFPIPFTNATNNSLNNHSGFSALPGAVRDGAGGFGGGGNDSGYWWSSTGFGSGSLAWMRYLRDNSTTLGRDFYYSKWMGMSVRCTKD